VLITWSVANRVIRHGTAAPRNAATAICADAQEIMSASALIGQKAKSIRDFDHLLASRHVDSDFSLPSAQSIDVES